MSRILHHVGRNDFKKTRQRQIGEKKESAAKELKERQEAEAERKIIEEAAKPFKSDWRLDFLSEAMTTAGLGMVNYPAEGDVDLQVITQTAVPGTPESGGSHGLYRFGNYDPAGFGGFILYLDTTKYDTLKVNVNKGNATSITYSWAYSGTDQTLSSGTNIITIPSSSRGKNVGIAFNAEKSGGTGATGAILSGTVFQRRTPINVFVPLDDPEANSFIRGGLGGSEERRKKLKDMLEAGNKLMIRNGIEPSKTSPGDIALDTIPYEPPSPGPGGYKPPGSYDPNKFFNIPTNHGPQFPSPNLPDTGPGRSSVPDGTKVAVSYPKMDPLDKLLKDIKDQEKKMRPGPGKPGKGRGMGDTWEGPGKIV